MLSLKHRGGYFFPTAKIEECVCNNRHIVRVDWWQVNCVRGGKASASQNSMIPRGRFLSTPQKNLTSPWKGAATRCEFFGAMEGQRCSYAIHTSPRWTPGSPCNAHGRRPAPRGQPPRSVLPTQLTTTKHDIRLTGYHPRRGGNRSLPIVSRRQQ